VEAAEVVAEAELEGAAVVAGAELEGTSAGWMADDMPALDVMVGAPHVGWPDASLQQVSPGGQQKFSPSQAT
jgi:hypothetical protein